MSTRAQRCTTHFAAIPGRKEAAAMEWFWASVAYAVFGAIGALGLFTMLYWFDVAAARSKRSTVVNARKR
jgi:hypothetical protein